VRTWLDLGAHLKEVLVKLASDEDWFVRLRVAENPSTPVDVLVILASDEDRRVRNAARR